MGRRRTAILVLLGLALACASPPPAVHIVQPGETVYRIATHYRVPVSQVLEDNDIRDPRALEPGTRLVISGTDRAAPSGALLPPPGLGPPGLSPLDGPEVDYGDFLSSGIERRDVALAESRAAGVRFSWPLRGRITSRFGRRGRRFHRGLDLGAARGAAVHAAEAGEVTFSGRNGGYGKLVVLSHKGGFATFYAHHSENRVRRGQRVEKGAVLGEVGSSGNARGPHLHFEIRSDGRSRDPLLYLPPWTPKR
jgi:murein DD-endopeptidase MepM/ murein hydrolase activator NlpD